MSTAAIPVHVGLVDDTGQVANDLPTLAGALSEQIAADFAPIWKVRASVGAYTAATLPAGCWAVHIQTKLDDPGALGYHTDENNQPLAYVELTSDYTVTVSHEVLEMLADPWGNRLHRAELPAGVDLNFAMFGLTSARSYVHYLLEVCDPCERTVYTVGGEQLSDFLLPGWYRTSPSDHLAYSRASGCTAPRQVADGGYVSFGVPSGEWFQVFNESGTLSIQDIGKFNRADHGSLREFTDAKAREYRSR